MPEAHRDKKINMLPSKDSQPTRESLERFIKSNIVRAIYNRVVCGDGRYTPGQSKGGLHMFGGDMGAIATIWKAGKDAAIKNNESELFKPTEENITRVVKAYQKAKEIIFGTEEFGNVSVNEARKLYLHTDTHVQGGMLCGCGHTNNMGTNAELASAYGVENEDIKAIYQFITNKKNKIDHEELQLQGNHAEQTVIKVHGPKTGGRAKYTLNSSNGSEMHFVVDEDRIKEYFNRLSSALHITGVNSEALNNAYAQQEATTAKKLALGKLVVDVFITDEHTVEIDYDENRKVV